LESEEETNSLVDTAATIRKYTFEKELKHHIHQGRTRGEGNIQYWQAVNKECFEWGVPLNHKEPTVKNSEHSRVKVIIDSALKFVNKSVVRG
jgi:hypothetical protein